MNCRLHKAVPRKQVLRKEFLRKELLRKELLSSRGFFSRGCSLCRWGFCRSFCRSLSRSGRSGSSTTTMSGTIGFQIRHKLLLLGEHRFQSVQLRLKLLNGDLRLALGSSRVLCGDPGAELAHVAVQLVPALHQGRHPCDPFLGGLVHGHPALLEGGHLLVCIVVGGHLRGGAGRFLQDLQLCLTLILEVLGVSKDLAGLNEGLWLVQPVDDSLLSLLHPRLECFDTGLELSKVLDILAELGALALDLSIELVQL